MNRENINLSTVSESEWFDIYIQHSNAERTDLIPFPSEDIQVITNGLSGNETAVNAIEIWNIVKSCIIQNMNLSRRNKVLDYGCGWGRITRLLPFYFDSDGLYGVDVDERLIESANRLVPQINFSVINSMETLPFDDNSFDIVFANSVFSHLSEKSAVFTLSELSRVTNRNGLVIISVLQKGEMEKFYTSNDKKTREWIEKILGDFDSALNEYEVEDFVWGDTGRWSDYGIAIIKDSWVEQKFKDNNLKLIASERTSSKGSQNYKVGVKK